MKNKKSSDVDIALEILRCLRGKRSAAQLSRKLGFQSNKVARWEAGHAVVTWADLLAACKVEKVPVRAQLEKRTPLNGDPADLKKLLFYYLPTHTNVEISRITGVTPSTVSKWLSGKASPPANLVFQMVKESKVSWSEFVMSFLPLNKEVSGPLQAIVREEEKTRSVLAGYPFIEVLIVLIQQKRPADREIFLEETAVSLGFEVTFLGRLFDQLVKDGVVEWSAKENAYICGLKNDFDMSSSPEAMTQALQFWTKYHWSLIRSPDMHRKTMATFASVALTKKNLEKAERLFIALIDEVLKMSEAQTSERVFNLTMFFSDVVTSHLGRTYQEK